eukprot:c18129_g1_i1.p1 GENE.c18129_g1_i1~~c18129_g1_i1.p1  ORF type:complete len:347 (-),score=66.08 c18129_g1_i1:97-1137(-)
MFNGRHDETHARINPDYLAGGGAQVHLHHADHNSKIREDHQIDHLEDESLAPSSSASPKPKPTAHNTATNGLMGDVFVDMPPQLFLPLLDHLRLRRFLGPNVPVPPPNIPPGLERQWNSMLGGYNLLKEVQRGAEGHCQLVCMRRDWSEVINGMYGFMFDLRNKSISGSTLRITELQVCGCSESKSSVYACAGSHHDLHNDASTWRMVSSGTKILQKQPSTLVLSPAPCIPPHATISIYVATDHICGVAFVAPSKDEAAATHANKPSAGKSKVGTPAQPTAGAPAESVGNSSNTSPAASARLVSAQDDNLQIFAGNYLTSGDHFSGYTVTAQGWHFQGVVEYDLIG